jgi:hypothetical protein
MMKILRLVDCVAAMIVCWVEKDDDEIIILRRIIKQKPKCIVLPAKRRLFFSLEMDSKKRRQGNANKELPALSPKMEVLGVAETYSNLTKGIMTLYSGTWSVKFKQSRETSEQRRLNTKLTSSGLRPNTRLTLIK